MKTATQGDKPQWLAAAGRTSRPQGLPPVRQARDRRLRACRGRSTRPRRSHARWSTPNTSRAARSRRVLRSARLARLFRHPRLDFPQRAASSSARCRSSAAAPVVDDAPSPRWRPPPPRSPRKRSAVSGASCSDARNRSKRSEGPQGPRGPGLSRDRVADPSDLSDLADLVDPLDRVIGWRRASPSRGTSPGRRRAGDLPEDSRRSRRRCRGWRSPPRQSRRG